MTKVAITGIGTATPLGNDFATIVQHLKKGQSGISLSNEEKHHQFVTHHAGYVDYSTLKYSPSLKSAHKLLKLADHAASQALKFANLDSDFFKKRIGAIILGAEPPTLELRTHLPLMLEKGSPQLLDALNGGLSPHILIANIARTYGFRGPGYLHLGTCSASAQAIGEAAQLLRSKRADVVICGGISSRVDPFSMARLARVGALAPTDGPPEGLSKPFDLHRKGFTMGEGAIFFVLERLDDALHRKIEPLCLLSGYGAALDGSSITDPHPQSLGMILSIEKALNTAGIKPKDVDYINAHGTSTPKNDIHETLAIKQVFKERAYRVSISSTKSMHGHLMSAAGAMEGLAALAALRYQFVPPTINHHNSDPDCDLDYTFTQAIDKKIGYVLSNSFGLGGQNASLVFERVCT